MPLWDLKMLRLVHSHLDSAQEALDRKTLDMRRKAVRIEKYNDEKEYHIYIKDVRNLTE